MKKHTPKQIRDYTEALKNFNMPPHDILTLKKKRKLPAPKRLKLILTKTETDAIDSRARKLVKDA